MITRENYIGLCKMKLEKAAWKIHAAFLSLLLSRLNQHGAHII